MGIFDSRNQRSISARFSIEPAAPPAVGASTLPVALNPDTILDDLRKVELDRIRCGEGIGVARLPSPAFLRLQHVPVLREDRQTRATGPVEQGLLTALHGLGLPIVFRFESRGGELFVLVGVCDQHAPEQARRALQSAFSFHFPGSLGAPIDGDALSMERVVGAVVVGTPHVRTESRDDEPDLGSLFAALRGEDAGFTIVARPLSRETTIEMEADMARSIHQWSGHLRQSVDLSSQASEVVSTTIRAEQVNRRFQQALDWAERMLDRLGKAQAEGLWNWSGVLWARNPQTLQIGSRLIEAMYSGPDAMPEPIRVIALSPQTDVAALARGYAVPTYAARDLATALPSDVAAALIRLPANSFPGFLTTPTTRFSTAAVSPEKGTALTLGDVLDRGVRTGRSLEVPVDELAKHCLVTGMTGSGKTNTCMGLLQGLSARGVPFLVIEPAKAEYRQLLKDPQIGPDFRVFTLGDENTAPFRLNPFDFEDGFPIGTHVDLLKAVLTSSFSMYGPMPHILEEAIIRAYERRGWDLATGRNRYEREVDRALLMPTLNDLLREIDEAVRAVGYAQELTMNFRGALRTRVKSLLSGAKGMMLGGQRSNPISELLERSTVLELWALGDDQEKALMMGLLLLRIYEYRHVVGPSERTLVHLTVVEEAHRILKNVSAAGTNPEVANVVGKAVDTFNSILAEIRAYGEGILIAEQIPSRLSPDAIKNTGLKITHRLHAPDDRELIGGSMVLTEEQKRHLARLPDLQSVVFGARLTEPALISARASKPSFTAGFYAPTDEEVGAAMALHRPDPGVLERLPSCHLCPEKCRRPVEAIDAANTADSPAYQAFRRELLTSALTETPGQTSGLDLSSVSNGNYCVVAHAAHRFFEERASFYGLSLPECVRLERLLMEACSGDSSGHAASLNVFWNLWRDALRRKKAAQGRTCRECEQALCYGYEMERYVFNSTSGAALASARTAHDKARVLRQFAGLEVGPAPPPVRQKLAYCFFLRRQSELGITGGHAFYRDQIAQHVEGKGRD